MDVFWLISSLAELARVVYLLLLSFLFKLRMLWSSVLACHSPSSLISSKSTCFLQPSSSAHSCSLWVGSSTSYFLLFWFRLIETNIQMKKSLTTKTNQPNLFFWETLEIFLLVVVFFFLYHNLRKRKGSLCLSEQCIWVVSLKAVQDSMMREGEAHGKYGYNLHVAMSHYSYLFFPPDICVSFQLSLTYPFGRVFRRMDFACLFLCTL